MELLWWGMYLINCLGVMHPVDAASRSSIWEHEAAAARGLRRLTAVKEYAHSQGFEATLRLVSESGNDTFGTDINPLRLVVRVEESTRLRVYISDYETPRWEVPQSIIPRPGVDATLGKEAASVPPVLAVSYTENPFGFAVTRIANSDVLFNSTPPSTPHGDEELLFDPLVFKDQYLEISTQLPHDSTLFGLGESTRSGLKLVKGTKYTLWTTDISVIYLNIDLYGSYPFYIDVREGGLSHGVLLLNSNGMEVTYNNDSLTYRVLGGVLDFYFFPGPSPLDVVDQYTQLVGRPAPQPYWSFGFHQCRWGYKNVSVVKSVVENYKKAKIPLDTLWNDIDYSDKYRDFTNDPDRFPLDEWRAFVDGLHANGQQYVILTDPGISMAYDDYQTYKRGLDADIYLKNQNGENYLGQVWPGPVYYPDFLNPKGVEWWINEVQLFHDKLPFDGLWIDMNEVSNFCTGTYCTWNGTIPAVTTDDCYLQCEKTYTKYDEPAFKLNHAGKYLPLANKTAAMTVEHYDGTLEYDAHSLYGTAEAIATNIALTVVRDKRPFLLSRSTFVGAGAYTAHWTGDNAATFGDLAYSIVTILNSGLFGVPMVGADICGFLNDVTEELCNRWIQTAAFHPFSRAHNNIANKGKELYLWETVAASARKALGLKYQLLPYFYTLNFESHKKGYPIVRPLFLAFPTDPKTLDISYQFLIGNSVLVSPVVTANSTSVEAYFPAGTWYNLFDWSQIVSKGENITLDAPWDVINVHLHEGAILPMQEPALTSAQVRKSPFTLVVAFQSNSLLSRAHGYVFLDNGEEIYMELMENQSSLVHFTATLESATGGVRGVLISHVEHGEYALAQRFVVNHVVLLGAAGYNCTGSLHVTKFPTQDDDPAVRFSYEGSKLHLSGLRLPLGKPFELRWSIMDT